MTSCIFLAVLTTMCLVMKPVQALKFDGAVCQLPGVLDVRNGVIAIKESIVLKITCRPGYDLVGSSALFCDEQRWNASLPTCQPQQPLPENVGYPPIVEDGNRCGSVPAVPNSEEKYETKHDVLGRSFFAVRYTCYRGHTLQPANYAVYCTGGNVVGTPPHCYAHCGYENGGCLHLCRNTDHGAICSCREGYTLADDWTSCTECPRGTYKSTNAQINKCTPCPPNSTTVVGGSTSLAACECIEGYRGDPAGGYTCKVIRCARFISPTNGQTIPNPCDNIYQSVCTFECNLGYELIEGASSARRRCQLNGYWSGTRAQCRS